MEGFPVQVGPPPVTDNTELNQWMQQILTVVQAIAAGKNEQESFRDDVLDTIRTYDRQGIAGLSSVSKTAGATYTANEQAMLNELKTLANGLKTNL